MLFVTSCNYVRAVGVRIMTHDEAPEPASIPVFGVFIKPVCYKGFRFWGFRGSAYRYRSYLGAGFGFKV